MIGTVSGVVLGFLLTLVVGWNQDHRRRDRYLRGLYRDLRRCESLDLCAGSDQLMNRLIFPHIERCARGESNYEVCNVLDMRVLQVYYLLDNFRRYAEIEMGLVVEETRARVEGEGCESKVLEMRKHIQDEALSTLEMSLSSYSRMAMKQFVLCYPKIAKRNQSSNKASGQ